ncbi:MAG: MGMT family protein [Pseudomonadota bacterium]
MKDECARIWQTISEIPAGSVATYGQIAELSGLPRRARLVGYALRNTPDHLDLPWHRVINAKGESSFPVDSESYREQIDRLRQEGVTVRGNKISLRQFRWKAATLDEMLWKPDD